MSALSCSHRWLLPLLCDSDREVKRRNTNSSKNEKQEQKTKAVNKVRSHKQAGFLKHTTGCWNAKTNTIRHPRTSTLFFLLTRFIDALQLRRAISIQAEGTRLLEKHAIAPSAASACWAASRDQTRKRLLSLCISFRFV